jgi:RIO-like serine/threonine protein kinase
LSSEECRQLCEKLNTVELLHLNKHAQLSVRVHCTALHCTALHAMRDSSSLLYVRDLAL